MAEAQADRLHVSVCLFDLRTQRLVEAVDRPGGVGGEPSLAYNLLEGAIVDVRIAWVWRVLDLFQPYKSAEFKILAFWSLACSRF